MPCRLCESTYVNRPCEVKNMIVKESHVELFNYKFITKYYQMLTTECPCKECLVKSICLNSRLECDIYLTFLEKASNGLVHVMK